MDVFGGTKPPSEAPDLKNLHAKIGQLILHPLKLRPPLRQGPEVDQGGGDGIRISRTN